MSENTDCIEHPKKHWDLFVKECKFWLDYYGLKGWDVRYVHDEDNDNAGSYWISVEARKITINLSRETQEWLCNTHEVQLTAFHEVTEAGLLGRLKEYAKHRYIQEREIDESTHEIVAVLENTIFEELRGNKKLKKKKAKINL